MAKWTKRILLTLGILIALLLIAAVLVPILFKDKIEAAVKREVNTHINAQVDWGDWDISLLRSFPNLTVDIADVRVTNVEPFAGTELAHIGRLTATIDIKSLFGEKIDIRRVGLVRPHIHVRVLEDGRANWDIAKGDSTAAVTETAADTASAFHIGLRKYWIEDGRLIYDDAALGFMMQLFGLDHEGSGDFTQDIFTLETETEVDTANVIFDGVRYLRNAKVDIDADLEMDLPHMKFTFKDNEAAINQLVLGFDGWLAMPGDDIDMDITWNAKKSDLATLLSLVPAEFATDLSGVDMSGRAGFSGHVKGTYNDDHMPGFAVNVDVDNGRFQYPDLPASVEDIFVDLQVNSPGGSDMDRMVVDLQRFAMTMAGNPVEARMHLTTPISDPTVDAALKAGVDLASVKTVVPMEGDDLRGRLDADIVMKGAMSDVDAQRFDRFTAAGELALQGMRYESDSLPFPLGIDDLLFAFSPRYLALDRFAGSIGSSQVQAKGRLDNYLHWWLRDSTLAGQFELTADKFDLNELMPAPPTAQGTEAGSDTTAIGVIELPGNIDFTVKAGVGEVTYDDLKLANVRGGLRIHEHRADLRDVFFNLFDGAVTVDGTYDALVPTAPRIDLAYDIRDMDIERTVTFVDMVREMVPIAKTCKGKFSTDLTMQATLNERMEPDYESLTGRGHLRTKNVQVDGFQPLVDIAKALKLPGIENTTLQDVDFTYRFENGRMITDPFNVQIDQLQANVQGSTAFADQGIDYDMRTKIPTKAFGAAAAQTAGSLLGEANR
ncbi:MAG: AsmA-like C-terminal region-containing protein, partial [Flavobacteriales bacterium]|nr:AsmA-like C-terminal region-containing protein [Flavobacteriales bacterium]